jgi:hypothetical protein
MAKVYIELHCPEHGLERFKIKIIKKYNINPKLIQPKFRTKPKYELSSIIIGRNVRYTDVKDYLINYLKEKGEMERILSIRFRF